MKLPTFAEGKMLFFFFCNIYHSQYCLQKRVTQKILGSTLPARPHVAVHQFSSK